MEDVSTPPDRSRLSGRSVVVTRAREQVAEMVEALESLGASVVVAPTIAFVEPSDGCAALDRAAGSLSGFLAQVSERSPTNPTDGGSSRGGHPAWIVFTSANAVRMFAAAMARVGTGDGGSGAGGSGAGGSGGIPGGAREGFGTLASPAAGVRIAAVGPATRDAVLAAGAQVDLVPQRFVAEGLLDVFPSPPQGGGRVLFPRAEVARDVLPDGLAEMGWTVDVVAVYRTVAAEVDEGTRAAVRGADAVLFASASSVQQFVELYGPDAAPPEVAVIGPATAARATELGLEVSVQPDEHTIPALIAALAGHLGPLRAT